MDHSGILFTAPNINPVNSLVNTSDNKDVALVLQGIAIPQFPLRSLRRVINALENGHLDSVTPMEWLNIFQQTDEWSFEDDDEKNKICFLIWQAILESPTANQIAVFKAAQYVDNREDEFPLALFETLELAFKFMPVSVQAQFHWLQLVHQQHYQQCANQLFEQKITLNTHLNNLYLPQACQYKTNILIELVNVVPNSLSAAQEKWLYDSAFQSGTTEIKAQLCDLLLQKLQQVGPLLEEMFRATCLPLSENSYWMLLSKRAQNILKAKFEIGGYHLFQSFFNALSGTVLHQSTMSEIEQNQLTRRMYFWSNYSDKIERVRFILPTNTIEEITSSAFLQQVEDSDLIELKPNAAEHKEVCILELDNIIAVEFLRGQSSELRLFKKNERNERRLLLSDYIDLAQLREMTFDGVHDHMILWQSFCERMLAKEYDLYPNDGLKRFLIGESAAIPYSKNKGMPKAKSELLEERVRQFSQWNHAFWQQEYQSNKYDNISDFEKKGGFYLALAKQAKVSGDSKGYHENLSKSALRNHPEATWLLGQKLLTDPSANKQLKMEGESLIKTAASLGHAQAIELVGHVENQPDKKGYSQYAGTTTAELAHWAKKHRANPHILEKVMEELASRSSTVAAQTLADIDGYLSELVD